MSTNNQWCSLWLNLARSVFKDFWFYPLLAGYYDIAHDPRSVNGFTHLANAWAKNGQRYKRGMYYLNTEWKLSGASALAASFTASPNPAQTHATITFDASIAAGSITQYQWDFDNDGNVDQTTTTPTTTYSFSTAGNYTVKLIVSDGSGSAETTRLITVNDPVCVPDCSGKACGDDDGCGGTCVVQTCGSGQNCDSQGVCVSSSNSSTGTSSSNTTGSGSGGSGCFISNCMN